MVFAINAPTEGEKTFENFKKKALEFGQKEGQPSTQSSLAPTATQTYATTYATTDPVTYTPTYAPTYNSETNPPAPAPTESEGTQHRVLVGANGTLTFYPQFVAAKPQDTIVCEIGL